MPEEAIELIAEVVAAELAADALLETALVVAAEDDDDVDEPPNVQSPPLQVRPPKQSSSLSHMPRHAPARQTKPRQ